jgi:hypothetical protein
MVNKWIKGAFAKHKPGALHRQLGYSVDHKIPKLLLKEIKMTPIGNMCRGHKVTRLLKERVVAAINAQKRRK